MSCGDIIKLEFWILPLEHVYSCYNGNLSLCFFLCMDLNQVLYLVIFSTLLNGLYF
jgi:hypothetical protein